MAAFWVALAILSPVLAELTWPRVRPKVASWIDLAERIGPWLWGIGPAYLALITGAIPARFFGLTGHSAFAWFGGAIICGALIGIAALLSWPAGEWPKPTRGVLDEPRWALYRAAGILWLGRIELGLLLGLGLALLEWSARFRPWRNGDGLSLRASTNWRAGTWETLARIAGSALVFALTRNFWLTALTQAVFLGMIRRSIALDREGA